MHVRTEADQSFFDTASLFFTHHVTFFKDIRH
jgi:hypothetical protein